MNPIQTEILRVLELEGRALLSCATRVKTEAEKASTSSGGSTWVKAVELLNQALDRKGKIVVTGVGKSGKVGEKIAATLTSTGSVALFMHPTEGLHGDLGVIQPQDVVLAISYTGNTEELIRILPSLRGLGVSVVSMCGKPDSKLAKESTVCLDVSVENEACPHNLAPTASTTLSLACGDALAMALMKLRGFDVERFAKNHPGGSLGSRLTLKVSDLMRPREEVGILSEGALMREILEKMTQRNLGGVLVEDPQGLLRGLITEGDLRRALKDEQGFFKKKAEEIMTRNPISVGPSVLAFEALALMENRPTQISVLPVVEAGKILGLLRLHDLVAIF